MLTQDVKFLAATDRERVLGKERRVVDTFASTIAAARPELARSALAKPVTMLLFGMMNWMFTWLRPDGRLTHAEMAPVVADLFLGGLAAVRSVSASPAALPTRTGTPPPPPPR